MLQYRAYKLVGATISERLDSEAKRFPRLVTLEPSFAALLPELVWNMGADQLARLAAQAMGPKPAPPGVGLDHLHDPAVSVREQAAIVVERLRRARSMSFRALVADAATTGIVVARFLALLELFREGVISFDQAAALGELTVRWSGSDQSHIEIDDEFDTPPDHAPEAP